jgi:DNA primase large subunit
MAPLLDKHLPLHPNSSQYSTLQEERKKDHYSHFILRLAFSSTKDLRDRFVRLESMLFRLRYKLDEARERQKFVESLDFAWEVVTASEKTELAADLRAASGPPRNAEDDGFFKVDWEKVPELVEHRKVFVKWGMAYVPIREQMSLVMNEFTRRLEESLEVSSRLLGTLLTVQLTSRALPNLDEDDRLAPILIHLTRSFATPDAAYDSSQTLPGQFQATAANVDQLAAHFPLCMSQLHTTLRSNSHLKHYGRLQYTLFLKAVGLSLDECILFWRRSFKLMTDDKFNKEYKYNIRHAYGDVGGDANRRGKGYSAYSCQKLLTEPLPSAGQTHGCPYRTFTVDNLVGLLGSTGVSDKDLIKGVREDVLKQRYHVACNRVFEHVHKKEIKEVKDNNIWGPEALDTILHPNEYFKRSYRLKHLGEVMAEQKKEVKDEY